MKSNELAKRTGRVILILSFLACCVVVGVSPIARAASGGGYEKYDFKVFKQKIGNEGIKLADPMEEQDLVLIKGEVLSVAVIAKSGNGVGESFVFVTNQGVIGEDVIVCFMPDMVLDSFSTALTSGYKIQAWGYEFPAPDIYDEITTKAFVVLAARVLHPDVPAGFSNLGIPEDILSGKA